MSNKNIKMEKKDSKSNFSLFEVVWAKLGDFPYWPGWIGSIKKNNIYEIYFFGEDTKIDLEQKLILKWANFDELTKNITEITEENKNLLFAISIALNAGETEMNILEHKNYVRNCSQKEKEKKIKECFEFLNYNREEKIKETKEKIKDKENNKTNDIEEKKDNKEFIGIKKKREELLLNQNKLEEIVSQKEIIIKKCCMEIYESSEKIKKKLKSSSKYNKEEITKSLKNSIELNENLNEEYSNILYSFEESLKEGFNFDLEKISKEKVLDYTVDLIKYYEDNEKVNDILLPFYHIFLKCIQNVYKNNTNLTFKDFAFVIKNGGNINVNNIKFNNEEILIKKEKRSAVKENIYKIFEIFYNKVPQKYLNSVSALFENLIFQISNKETKDEYKKNSNLICNEIKQFANGNSNSNLQNVEIEKDYNLKIDY